MTWIGTEKYFAMKTPLLFAKSARQSLLSIGFKGHGEGKAAFTPFRIAFRGTKSHPI